MTLQNMVQHLVNELGWSQTKIAKEAGISQPVVHRALNGIDVHYSNGRKLEALFYEHVGSAGIQNMPTTTNQ